MLIRTGISFDRDMRKRVDATSFAVEDMCRIEVSTTDLSAVDRVINAVVFLFPVDGHSLFYNLS